MSRGLLYGLVALALTVMAGPFGQAQAGNLGCNTPIDPDRSAQVCPVQAPIVLAQTRTKTMTQFKVPAGDNYVQLPGQRSFKRIASGTSLEDTDCVQVNCPSTFDPDVTCWKCVEREAAAE
jgi:hypothetical protein